MSQESSKKSVQFVKGVGSARAKSLAKLGINTIEDLLYFFPRDYEDRSNKKKMKYVKPGEIVTVKGKVIKINEQRVRKGLSILRVTFNDDTDIINGIWFNQSYLKKQFKKNKWYYLSGELNAESWRFKKKEINNPVFESVGTGDNIHTGRIVPIYPLTKGMTQKRMRKVLYNAVNDYVVHIKDILPDYIQRKYSFTSLQESIRGLHFPQDRQDYIKARKRLAFEELFFLQLLVLNRREGTVVDKGTVHQDPGSILNKFLDLLSFKLTSAQQRVWREIKKDMESEISMQRLLQGDVGSGKTIVATLALIETMANGYQGIFMAPTEILAEQHFLKLDKLLKPMGFKTCLLVGSLTQSQRQEIEEQIKNNEVDLIIGTHALFQKGVDYNDPGLVVIDEQHRFGVEQRYSLKNKGDNPDLLVMTATPIPRSLALTLYGDLDLSIIDEMPPGRSPVITTWRDKNSRSKIYSFVRDKLEDGRQAYVVCPLIDESDEVDAISAEKLKQELEGTFFQDYYVGLLHSKLSSADKNKTMEEFRQGKIDLLVSTTVVEVGVDVANASVMVIESAERFGLAQLHQLRGRVGRGQYQSFCILIASPSTEDSRKRLKVITETNDGFEIAEEDLKIRGPGEFFGTRQHGIPDLKVADIIKDQKLLNLARNEAEKLMDIDNWQNRFTDLKEKIVQLELKV